MLRLDLCVGHQGYDDKLERRQEASLLQLLLVLERPWASISMDFISGFAKVNDMSLVMVMVNRYTRYAIFNLALVTC